jgi:hypothetical protein
VIEDAEVSGAQALAKWIAEATSILSHSRAARVGAESWAYTPDKQAMAHVRDLVGKPCLITVRSARGIKPVVTMDYGDALRWAHD